MTTREPLAERPGIPLEADGTFRVHATDASGALAVVPWAVGLSVMLTVAGLLGAAAVGTGAGLRVTPGTGAVLLGLLVAGGWLLRGLLRAARLARSPTWVEGALLSGTLAQDSEGTWVLDVTYRFQSPLTGRASVGRGQAFRSDLVGRALPGEGTRVKIRFLDDRMHAVR